MLNAFLLTATFMTAASLDEQLYLSRCKAVVAVQSVLLTGKQSPTPIKPDAPVECICHGTGKSGDGIGPCACPAGCKCHKDGQSGDVPTEVIPEVSPEAATINADEPELGPPLHPDLPLEQLLKKPIKAAAAVCEGESCPSPTKLVGISPQEEQLKRIENTVVELLKNQTLMDVEVAELLNVTKAINAAAVVKQSEPPTAIKPVDQGPAPTENAKPLTVQETTLLVFISAAGHCPGCEQVKLDQAAGKLPAIARFVEIDKEPELYATYRVTRVPTFIVLVNGKEVKRQIGYNTPAAVKQLVPVSTGFKPQPIRDLMLQTAAVQ